MLECAQNDLQLNMGVPTICGVLAEGNVKVRRSNNDWAKKLVKNLMEGERKH